MHYPCGYCVLGIHSVPRAVMHSMVKGSRNVDIEENEVNNDANVSAPPVAFCLSTGLKSSKQ